MHEEPQESGGADFGGPIPDLSEEDSGGRRHRPRRDAEGKD
jgi:hypothetical protein